MNKFFLFFAQRYFSPSCLHSSGKFKFYTLLEILIIILFLLYFFNLILTLIALFNEPYTMDQNLNVSSNSLNIPIPPSDTHKYGPS